MSLQKNYKSNTIITFLISIAFVWLFFYWKHDPQLSTVNMFNVDPYDAVGSIAIQVSLIASCISVLRLFLYYTGEGIHYSNVILILRGNLLSQFSIIIAMISNLIALTRFNSGWINSSSGVLLTGMVISFLIITILVVCRTLKVVSAYNIETRFRLFSFKFILALSGFILLVFYPFQSHETIIWALFTAYAGMFIQIITLSSLAFLVIPPEEIVFEDLIDVIFKLYRTLKVRLQLMRYFADKTGRILFNPRISLVIDWLNPRKHKWRLMILIFLIMGVLMSLLEGIGEKWLGVNLKSLLLFSVYIVGEAIIIVLFYHIFRKYLGIIRWNQDAS